MTLKLALVGAVAVFATATTANATVYTVIGQTISPATVTGTITTNGALGTLSMADITAVDVTISDGINSATLVGPKGILVLMTGDAITATAGGLYFNFGATDESYFDVQSDDAAAGWCMEDGDTDVSCNGISDNLAINLDGAAYQGPVQTDKVEFATSGSGTPEPATWALMLVGVSGLGGALRMRRRQASVTA